MEGRGGRGWCGNVPPYVIASCGGESVGEREQGNGDAERDRPSTLPLGC